MITNKNIYILFSQQFYAIKEHSSLSEGQTAINQKILLKLVGSRAAEHTRAVLLAVFLDREEEGHCSLGVSRGVKAGDLRVA